MKCVNCDEVDVTGRAQRYPGIPMCEKCESEHTVREAAPDLLEAAQAALRALRSVCLVANHLPRSCAAQIYSVPMPLGELEAAIGKALGQ